MSEVNSTPNYTPDKPRKPAKPSPDFPLFAHAAGVWAKKIRGKMPYFGPWSDPEGALKNYQAQAEALHAGRKPRPAAPEGATVKEVVNHFLYAKEVQKDAGELSPRTWTGYREACTVVIAAFGKARTRSEKQLDSRAKSSGKIM